MLIKIDKDGINHKLYLEAICIQPVVTSASRRVHEAAGGVDSAIEYCHLTQIYGKNERSTSPLGLIRLRNNLDHFRHAKTEDPSLNGIRPLRKGTSERAAIAHTFLLRNH